MRLNPSSAWTWKDVPELRIVDDDLWQAVKARQASTRHTMQPGIVRARRPKVPVSPKVLVPATVFQTVAENLKTDAKTRARFMIIAVRGGTGTVAAGTRASRVGTEPAGQG